MVKGDGELTQQALDMLEALRRRRGWTDLTSADMVIELARDALATYMIVDVSLGDLPMAGQDKEEPELTVEEMMRRDYAEWEKNDPYKHMTDEQVLAHAGDKLHQYLLEVEQRRKEGKIPSGPDKGRG